MDDSDRGNDDSTASRRNVLKSAGALGVGTLGTAAISGSAAADDDVTSVGYVIVEDLDLEYRNSVMDFGYELWHTEIDDDEGNYGLYINTPGYYRVPRDELPDSGSLSDRRERAEELIARDKSSFYDRYDAIIFIDDYDDGDDDTYAIAQTNAANPGNDKDKVSIVNAWYEENGELPREYWIVGTPGIAARPLLQMHGAMHPEHVGAIHRRRSKDTYSVMWNGDGARCQADDVSDYAYVEQWCSDCTVEEVREFLREKMMN